jgi:hypothetical protein
MITVNLFDSNFAHTRSAYGFDTATVWRKPTKISYVRNEQVFDGATLFTDDFIFSSQVDKVKSKYKIAWCQESPAVKPYSHAAIHGVENKFDFIFTHNKQKVAEKPEKYKFLPAACCWVKDYTFDISKKIKLASHIYTGKNFTEGHALRHTITQLLRNSSIDIFGEKQFNKTEVHQPYKFSIIIENCRSSGYFSEKIIDCLVQGTIPIYWGDPTISSYFNMKGIIAFSSIDEIASLRIDKEYYNNNLDAVRENIAICEEKYLSSDDNLADLLKENNIHS